MARLPPLNLDLAALTIGSPLFASSNASLVTDSATMLVRCGIDTVELSRQMGKQARTYLLGDLRQGGKDIYRS